MDNDTEFLAQANAKIEALDEYLSEHCDELSTLRNGNVLTVDLDDGQQVVLNIQTPMHEIWLASRFGGLHFQFKDGDWRDTRSGKTLDETVVEVLTRLGIEFESA